MASLLTPEQNARINELQLKYAAGIATPDDIKEFVAITRQGRVSALTSSNTAKAKKAKAEIPSADELLADLDAMLK